MCISSEAATTERYLDPPVLENFSNHATTSDLAACYERDLTGRHRVGDVLVRGRRVLAGEDPDQLPLLQHALLRTWQYWSAHNDPAREIAQSDYEAIGTMQNALSRHATEAAEFLAGLFGPGTVAVIHYGSHVQGIGAGADSAHDFFIIVDRYLDAYRCLCARLKTRYSARVASALNHLLPPNVLAIPARLLGLPPA